MFPPVDGIMGALRLADLRLAALTSILVLAWYLGSVDGFNHAHSSRNLAESVTAAAQLVYGTLALCALIAVHKSHRSARPFIEFLGAIFVATAMIQPVAWGKSLMPFGILSGLVASIVVGLIVWLWGADRPEFVAQRAPSKSQGAKAKKVETALQVSSRDAEIERELDRIKAKVARANPLNTLQVIPVRVAQSDPLALQVFYRTESAGSGASLSMTAPRSA